MSKMTDSNINISFQQWESAKLEYEKAFSQYLHYTSLRRQDMAFVTTVQIAIFTIIGSNLLQLDIMRLILSFIAFFVLLLGVNNERRLTAYMAGYMIRARQIESEYGLSLISTSTQEVNKRKLLISNTIVFPLYYCIFCISWIIVWVLNIINLCNK